MIVNIFLPKTVVDLVDSDLDIIFILDSNHIDEVDAVASDHVHPERTDRLFFDKVMIFCKALILREIVLDRLLILISHADLAYLNEVFSGLI